MGKRELSIEIGSFGARLIFGESRSVFRIRSGAISVGIGNRLLESVEWRKIEFEIRIRVRKIWW